MDLCSRFAVDKTVVSAFLKSITHAQIVVTSYLIAKSGPPPVPAAPAPAAVSPTAAVGTGAAGAAGAGEAVAFSVVKNNPALKTEGAAQFINLSTSSVEQ
jgi:tetrahydromethanopterin S-methyltransferase subunit D